MSEAATRYRCRSCGWVGTEDEMSGDYYVSGEDEVWSNTLCPRCGCGWANDLETDDNYEVVHE